MWHFKYPVREDFMIALMSCNRQVFSYLRSVFRMGSCPLLDGQYLYKLQCDLTLKLQF